MEQTIGSAIRYKLDQGLRPMDSLLIANIPAG